MIKSFPKLELSFIIKIKLYELGIGWSYGKTTPDFDPVVINGELVEGK